MEYPGYYHNGENVELLNDTLDKRKDGQVYVQVVYIESPQQNFIPHTVNVDEIIFSTDRKKNEEIKADLKRKAGMPVPPKKAIKAKIPKFSFATLVNMEFFLN